MKIFKLAGCLAVVLALSVRAEQGPIASNAPAMEPAAPLPHNAAFFAASHQENTALIRAGKLAEQHAQKATTFRFAVRILTDHQKLDLQLAQFARNSPLSPELDATHMAMLARLETFADPSFDSAYLDAMQLELQQAITLYQNAENSESDPNTKNFITSALTLLRAQMTLLQETQQRLPEQQGFHPHNNTSQ